MFPRRRGAELIQVVTTNHGGFVMLVLSRRNQESVVVGGSDGFERMLKKPEQREAIAPVTGKRVSRVAKSDCRPVSVTRRMLCAAGGFRSNKGVPLMIRLPKWLFMALALALLVGLAGTAAAAEIK